jgi:hypothetical protein
MNADPLFTNGGKNDFTLQSASPAIDTGTALTNVTTDYAGVQRPEGAGYDSAPVQCLRLHPHQSPPAAGLIRWCSAKATKAGPSVACS